MAFLDTLLGAANSPYGRGFIPGLLAASGYSTTPTSFGQALAQGMAGGEQLSRQSEQDALRKQLGLGNLDLQRQQLALQGELGRGRLDLQRQQVAQGYASNEFNKMLLGLRAQELQDKINRQNNLDSMTRQLLGIPAPLGTEGQAAPTTGADTVLTPSTAQPGSQNLLGAGANSTQSAVSSPLTPSTGVSTAPSNLLGNQTTLDPLRKLAAAQAISSGNIKGAIDVLTPPKLSSEERKLNLIAQEGLSSTKGLINVLNSGNFGWWEMGNTLTPNTFRSTEGQLFDLYSNNLKDLIGRIRTGAAVTEGEKKSFAGLIPMRGDSQVTINKKLEQLNERFSYLYGLTKGEDVSKEQRDTLQRLRQETGY